MRDNYTMFSIRALTYHFVLPIFALFLIASCSDDPPTKPPDETPATWVLAIPADGDDALSAVAALSDGNYLALGFTNSNGAAGEDFYAVKFSVDGDTLWTRQYGGSGGDIGTEIVGTHDGGAVLGGLSNSFGANGLDIWIVRIDSLGDTLWSHSFGSTGLDRINQLILTSDNSILAVGAIAMGSDRHAWAAKIASDGALLWDRQYLGLGDAELVAAEELEGGGVFFGAKRWGTTPFAAWLTIDANADSVSADWYIFRAGYYVQSMVRGPGDLFILAGRYLPSVVEPRSDFFAMRINDQNHMQWERRLGGADDDDCYEILALPDGNLMMVGNTRSYDGSDWDIYTITIDTTGVVVDETVYKDDIEAEMAAICPTPDGRYIIVGSQTPSGMPSDIMIRKMEL